MTYSLVARDAATGDLGVAVQSRWFSVGSIVPWAEAGVGAVATQAFPEAGYGPRGLGLMRTGMGAPDALRALLTADGGAARRQVAMIDARGGVANHTGLECLEACGGCVSENVAAQGNILARSGIWDVMMEAFASAGGALANRLVSALESAEAEGGDMRGSQSSALLVVAGKASGHPSDVIANLRVDDSDQPIVELRRLLTVGTAYDKLGHSINLASQGDLEEAAEGARQAAEVVRDDDQMAAWCGVILAAAGCFDEARPLLERAIGVRREWVQFVERLQTADVVHIDARFLATLPGWSTQ